MKKFKYLILSVVFVSQFLFSCEKDLDRYPLDEISEETFFKTTKDFEMYANNFYSQIPELSTISDNGDLTISGSSNATAEGTYILPESDGTWNNAYTNIRNSFILIEKHALLEDKEVINETKPYIAEARFFVAMQYYRLLRRFGGVPLIKKVLKVDSPELYAPRNTSAEVFDYIKEQLELSIADLPLKKELSVAKTGRVTQTAARALLARAALFVGTWNKFHETGDYKVYLELAKSMSNTIMENDEYELFDFRDKLGADNYRHMFILSNKKTNPASIMFKDNKEAILVRRRDGDLNPEGSAGLGRQFGDKYLSPTKKFADMFLCSDGLPIDKSPLFEGYDSVATEYKNRDPRMTQVLITPLTTYWSNSLGSWTRDWAQPDSGGVMYEVELGTRTQTGYKPIKFVQETGGSAAYNYASIRLAEVYLIYAEATYELTESISNEDLNKSINKIRARVGMPSLTNEFVTANSLNMQEEIRRERNIELFMENDRRGDLRRWKTAHIEMPKPVRGIVFTGTQYETDDRWKDLDYVTESSTGAIIIQIGRKFEDKHYLRPIPNRQIQVNDKLIQNPGWE